MLRPLDQAHPAGEADRSVERVRRPVPVEVEYVGKAQNQTQVGHVYGIDPNKLVMVEAVLRGQQGGRLRVGSTQLGHEGRQRSAPDLHAVVVPVALAHKRCGTRPVSAAHEVCEKRTLKFPL